MRIRLKNHFVSDRLCFFTLHRTARTVHTSLNLACGWRWWPDKAMGATMGATMGCDRAWSVGWRATAGSCGDGGGVQKRLHMWRDSIDITINNTVQMRPIPHSPGGRGGCCFRSNTHTGSAPPPAAVFSSRPPLRSKAPPAGSSAGTPRYSFKNRRGGGGAAVQHQPNDGRWAQRMILYEPHQHLRVEEELAHRLRLQSQRRRR